MRQHRLPLLDTIIDVPARGMAATLRLFAQFADPAVHNQYECMFNSLLTIVAYAGPVVSQEALWLDSTHRARHTASQPQSVLPFVTLRCTNCKHYSLFSIYKLRY